MLELKEKKQKEKKTSGKVYTPHNIVKHILDLSGYKGQLILAKHAIDNSCGDGAFLCEIVTRYIKEARKVNLSNEQLVQDLGFYIHGIELNPQECEKAIDAVDNIAKENGLEGVKWDIICADTLTVTKYDGKMDFVLGNPPYVRVHNLGENYEMIKNFHFTKSGMTDLFIVFYEIGLKMLNENGILGYITPSSLYNSLASKIMRRYFVEQNLLKKVVNLKHAQVFDAVTYTTILVLTKSNQAESVEYFEYDETNDKIIKVDDLLSEDFFIKGDFYFAKKKELKRLRAILEYKPKTISFEVKNGFATLADKVFIGKFDFEEYVIPIVKASTGTVKQCFFPYQNGVLLPYEKLIQNPQIKSLYEQNEEDLKKRSLEKRSKWYGFGRSQGINDVSKNKYAISSLIKDIEGIKINHCKAGVGVYSGLYILTDYNEEKVTGIIKTDEFISYISLLGKYKNGGYYTFSSGDLKKYLEYMVKSEKKQHEQLGIFGCN